MKRFSIMLVFCLPLGLWAGNDIARHELTQHPQEALPHHMGSMPLIEAVMSTETREVENVEELSNTPKVHAPTVKSSVPMAMEETKWKQKTLKPRHLHKPMMSIGLRVLIIGGSVMILGLISLVIGVSVGGLGLILAAQLMLGLGLLASLIGMIVWLVTLEV